MHIIIDRALTMYSLHYTCKLIVTASLHKDNPGCSRAASTPTHGFSLLIYSHQVSAPYIAWFASLRSEEVVIGKSA